MLPTSGLTATGHRSLQVLMAGVEHTRLELCEHLGETLEVRWGWGGDQIDVVGHAHVAVYLYGDAPDHHVLDPVGVERGEEKLDLISPNWVGS
jgi:hypothetical protein